MAADMTLDRRGAFANPIAVNDMKPTTRFHPSELPADLEAIRRFPKHLIDVNHYTESPSGDASQEHRLERAAKSWEEVAWKMPKEAVAEIGKIFGYEPPVAEAPAEVEELPADEEVKSEHEEEPEPEHEEEAPPVADAAQ